MLFISYGAKIEPYKTELKSLWYKGYGHVVSGHLIEEFVDAVEKYSNYNVREIRQEIKRKQAWYYERNPE